MDNYFADYDAYPENSIARISSDGILFSDGRTILFDECARNFRRYSENTPDTNCIGEKDMDDGSFIFYCSPQPLMIKFSPKPFWIRVFAKSVLQQMSEWENLINEYGYSLTVSERKEDI